MNAYDLIQKIEQLFDESNCFTDHGIVVELKKLMQEHKQYNEAHKQEADRLTREKADDKMLNYLAGKYGITLNQVNGLLTTCEELNKQMTGTGIVAVPFWFATQYEEMKELNHQLTLNTQTVVDTMQHIDQKGVEAGGVTMMHNKSTGFDMPVIRGVNAPREGDEHLDEENIYLNAAQREYNNS